MRHHELSLTGLNFPACLNNLELPHASMHTSDALCTCTHYNFSAEISLQHFLGQMGKEFLAEEHE